MYISRRPWPPNKRWYVFHTKYQQEFLAVKELLRQGFEVFLPYIEKERKRGEKVVIQQIPVFPTYGFVRFDKLTDKWKPICSTYGIKHILSTTPEEPIAVPRGVIEQLRNPTPVPDETIAEEVQIPLPLELIPLPALFKVGDYVKVTSGPMAGHIGICEWSDDNRTRLLMEILNGKVPITFGTRSLEAIEVEQLVESE